MLFGITRYLTGQTLLQAAAVTLIIATIFVFEKVGGQISRALEAGLQLTALPALLLATLPLIFSIALPLALLIAIYRVFLRLREDGELVSLANLGIRPWYFMGLAGAYGALFMTGVLVVSGFVEPYSRYVHRLLLFEARKDLVREGLHTGDIRKLLGYVAAKPNGAEGERSTNVFIVDTNPGTFQRLISADRVELTSTADPGVYNVDLVNLEVIFLNHALHDRRSSSGKQDSLLFRNRDKARPTIGAPQYARSLTLGEFARFPPRLSRDDQRYLTELVAPLSGELRVEDRHFLRFAEILLQGWLCLLAPFAAFLAVSFTSTGRSVVVLPAAAAGLFGLNILVQNLAKALSDAGASPLILPGAMQFAILMLLAATAYRTMRQGAFLKPRKTEA